MFGLNGKRPPVKAASLLPTDVWGEESGGRGKPPRERIDHPRRLILQPQQTEVCSELDSFRNI